MSFNCLQIFNSFIWMSCCSSFCHHQGTVKTRGSGFKTPVHWWRYSNGLAIKICHVADICLLENKIMILSLHLIVCCVYTHFVIVAVTAHHQIQVYSFVLIANEAAVKGEEEVQYVTRFSWYILGWHPLPFFVQPPLLFFIICMCQFIFNTCHLWKKISDNDQRQDVGG